MKKFLKSQFFLPVLVILYFAGSLIYFWPKDTQLQDTIFNTIPQPATTATPIATPTPVSSANAAGTAPLTVKDILPLPFDPALLISWPVVTLVGLIGCFFVVNKFNKKPQAYRALGETLGYNLELAREDRDAADLARTSAQPEEE